MCWVSGLDSEEEEFDFDAAKEEEEEVEEEEGGKRKKRKKKPAARTRLKRHKGRESEPMPEAAVEDIFGESDDEPGAKPSNGPADLLEEEDAPRPKARNVDLFGDSEEDE